MRLIDFFCGAGGASCGLEHSDHTTVVAAVNHDPDALACHAANHPHVQHYDADIKVLNPEELQRNHGPVDAFWWSAECTHLSNAKGGQPRDADSRMLNFELPRFARVLRPTYIFIENVAEFLSWGPLKGHRADPERKGELHNLWVRAMERLGYRYEYRILTAADYGAHTTRPRYYGIFALEGAPIRWPEPTHRDPREPVSLMNAALRPWRTAREVLNLDDHGRSIFDRPRPLVPATMKRIAYGVERFAPESEREPLQYLIAYYGQGRAHSVDEPLPTITTRDRFALVTAQFVTAYYGGMLGSRRSHDLDEPVPTVTTANRFSFVTTGKDSNGIRDIRMRMLTVEELKRAQGFPRDYILPESQTLAKKFIGNSVVPVVAEALVRAQVSTEIGWQVPVETRLGREAVA